MKWNRVIRMCFEIQSSRTYTAITKGAGKVLVIQSEQGCMVSPQGVWTFETDVKPRNPD